MNLRFILVTSVCTTLACCAGEQAGAQDSEPTNAMSPGVLATYRATTWGAETNGLKFGAQVASTGLASSNKCKVFTYVYNTRSTNRHGVLVPPHGSRLDIELKNKSGKEVPRTRAGNALCRPVPEHLWSKGNILFLPAQHPRNFDIHFDIRDCFKIKQPGTYTLALKARLYATKVYPDYVPIDLPGTRLQVVLTGPDLER